MNNESSEFAKELEKTYQDNVVLDKQDYIGIKPFLLSQLSYCDSIQLLDKESVNLSNVYIPVPADLSVNISVENETIANAKIVGFNEDYEFNVLELSTSLSERLNSSVFFGEVTERPSPRERSILNIPYWYEGEHRDVFRLCVSDLFGELDRIQLIGKPGSGKSTFCKYATAVATHQLIDDGSFQAEEVATLHSGQYFGVPVYIEARDFFSDEIFSPPSQRINHSGLLNYLQQRYQFDANENFRNILQRSKGLVVLDGLDEIPLPNGERDVGHRRKQIDQLVVAASSLFESVTVLVTCRDYAFDSWEFSNFQGLALGELQEQDSSQLAHNLAKAKFGRNYNTSEVLNFTKQLSNIPNALKDYPLFLTMLSAVYWQDTTKQLPEHRSALYEQTIRVLLCRWTEPSLDKEASLIQQLGCSVEELVLRLKRVAFHTHVEHYAAGVDEVGIRRATLLDHLFQLPGNSNLESIISYLSQHSGILVGRRNLEFKFAHNGFKEFLAAAAIYDQVLESYKSGGSRPFDILCELAHVSTVDHWREVVRLLAEITFHGERKRDIWDLLNSLMSPSAANSRSQISQLRYLAIEVFLSNRLEKLDGANQKALLTKMVGHARRMLSNHHKSVNERVVAANFLDILDRRVDGAGVNDKSPDMKFIRINSGLYTFGVDDEEKRRLSKSLWAKSWQFTREEPNFSAQLESFSISRFPVTERQFNTFLDSSDGYSDSSNWCSNGLVWLDAENSKRRLREDSSRPAGNVSWYEASAFCTWLSRKWKKRISLPTELQWEAAARANGYTFTWGDKFRSNYANYDDSGYGDRVPVGCFMCKENYEAPQDLNGNVWEWCISSHTVDGRHEFGYPYAATDGREDLNPPLSCEKIVRGGSYLNPPFLLRSTYRGKDKVTSRAPRNGFRIVINGVDL